MPSTRIIDTAYEEAKRSAQNHKHGAVLVRSGKIVATGHNKVTRKVPSHMFSIHAEMAAIKASHQKCMLADSQIYVVRVNKEMNLADSKPCELCQRFMKHHGISRVFYSTNSGDIASMCIQ